MNLRKHFIGDDFSDFKRKLGFFIQGIIWKKSSPQCPHCMLSDSVFTAYRKFSVNIEYCKECHLYFTNPIYKAFFSKFFYNKLYRAEGLTTEVPPDDILEEYKKNNFSGTDKYFIDRIQRIKLIDKNITKLLEIGSSWGYFLFQANSLGFSSVGIEISESRREIGRKKLNVDIRNALSVISKQYFDVVYTAHTLEHFENISRIFLDIHQLLRIGGFLIIEVPHFDPLKRGKQALSIIGTVHPLGFTGKFFEKNLPRYGFKLIGFFNSYDDFPSKPQESVDSSNIILLAEKVNEFISIDLLSD